MGDSFCEVKHSFLRIWQGKVSPVTIFFYVSEAVIDTMLSA